MPSDYLLNKLALVIDEADEASLHDFDPGDDGTENEISGGSPAYARVAITGWAAGAAAGTREATLASAFNVPADTDVAWIGLWNGSQYLDKAPALVSVVAQDTLTITLLRYKVQSAV